MPNHVAIIMDGDGRWATSRGLSRSQGHRAGCENLKNLAVHILNKGVKYLSVYAFSTENFKRSKAEVDFLMNLFKTQFKNEFKFLKDKDIKVVFSGSLLELSNDVVEAMNELSDATKDNTSGVLNICLNYGGRREISEMVKELAKEVKDNKLSVDTIDEEFITHHLYQDLPDIDLLIRTSGEQRLSNFMLWQASYAELYFTNTYFPDFDANEFDKALDAYFNRDRKFGGIKNEN